MMHIAGGILLGYLAIAFGLPLIALTVAGIVATVKKFDLFMWALFAFAVISIISTVRQ